SPESYKPFLHHMHLLRSGSVNLFEDLLILIKPARTVPVPVPVPVPVLLTAAPIRKPTGEVVGMRWILKKHRVTRPIEKLGEAVQVQQEPDMTADEKLDAGAEWFIRAIEGEHVAAWRAFLSAAEGQHKRDKQGQAERIYEKAVENMRAILPTNDPALATCLFY